MQKRVFFFLFPQMLWRKMCLQTYIRTHKHITVFGCLLNVSVYEYLVFDTTQIQLLAFLKPKIAMCLLISVCACV